MPNSSQPYYDDGKGIVIWNCDNREVEVGPVDHVITDPPYGDAATHAGHLSTVANRQALGFTGISETEMVDLVGKWGYLASRWVVFTCEWKYCSALDKSGDLVRMGIWRKPDGAPQFTGDRPGMGWEAVAICHRTGKKRWNGGGRHAFWSYPKGSNQTGHPTGKPLALYLSFVDLFTDVGDTIYDPFCGSGTTLVAAKQLGRKAVGVEINEKYCEIAAKRLQQDVMDFDAAPELSL